MARKVNIKVVNELGEVVYPQGVDWDKLIKRLTAILELIGAGLGVVIGVIVIINNTGGGGGFRIQRIIIEPAAGLTRSR